ncbi:MAG: OmpH family outer membrane protein, partial [Cyclobacteriaceae bacterium]
LQQSLQEFQVNAEQSMIKKRNDLLEPAVEKIGNAIKEVAEENNYTHVFSAGSPGFDVLLYAREEDDISDLVLTKLGVTPPSSGN